MKNKTKQSQIKILTGKSFGFFSPHVFNEFKSSISRAGTLEISSRHAKLNFIPQPSFPLSVAFHRKNRNLKLILVSDIFFTSAGFLDVADNENASFLLYTAIFYAKVNIYPALPYPYCGRARLLVTIYKPLLFQ